MLTLARHLTPSFSSCVGCVRVRVRVRVFVCVRVRAYVFPFVAAQYTGGRVGCCQSHEYSHYVAAGDYEVEYRAREDGAF